VDEQLEIVDGPTIWRFDRDFLSSNWTCVWGRGCQGILDEPAEHLGQGCCSVGADLANEDEAMMTAALASTLTADRFEHRAHADAGGIFSDETRTNTAIVDGACIFLNRPGFAGGAGCALHLAALERGESPMEWKPSVCWQLPIKVDWELQDDGTEIADLHRWRRADWGPEGETMAWCCTEERAAYIGERPVVETLAAELRALVGETVYVELRRRLDAVDTIDAGSPSPVERR
jgi:hypothetical protein